ncbi:hypothetical protein BpHYR1_037146 [Brachionus plicatilis]|uniref:Uncharacterized protein n=1 Tax=Brachionus plicatilis TaxID=10195 RepID=A0A3M7T220_BRAPC|nr:hypothetical protein BpHYR1_037146 [Brachionus plicatilis]
MARDCQGVMVYNALNFLDILLSNDENAKVNHPFSPKFLVYPFSRWVLCEISRCPRWDDHVYCVNFGSDSMIYWGHRIGPKIHPFKKKKKNLKPNLGFIIGKYPL